MTPTLCANAVAVHGAKRDAERAGITNMGFNIGVRRLVAKAFIELADLWDERDGEQYDGVRVTDSGWSWIDANESRFVLQRSLKTEGADDPAF